MADGWIELFDVETDEVELLLVFDRFEPVDYACGVFPLVEVVFFRDCAVDAVDAVDSSPDKWATTKQACRDELVVYLSFSSIFTALYFYVLSTVLRKSSFTLYIYIYIYTL